MVRLSSDSMNGPVCDRLRLATYPFNSCSNTQSMEFRVWNSLFERWIITKSKRDLETSQSICLRIDWIVISCLAEDTYKLIQLLFPLKEHCFCLTDLFMIIILFYFLIYFLVNPTESEVQKIKQCSCQVQVEVHRKPVENMSKSLNEFWHEISVRSRSLATAGTLPHLLLLTKQEVNTVWCRYGNLTSSELWLDWWQFV